MTTQEQPAPRPRCGGTPGKPGKFVRVDVGGRGHDRYEERCTGCANCAPDTQSGGRPTVEEAMEAYLHDHTRNPGGYTEDAYRAGWADAESRASAALQEARDRAAALERWGDDQYRVRETLRLRAEAAESTIAGLRADLDREKADGLASRLMLKATMAERDEAREQVEGLRKALDAVGRLAADTLYPLSPAATRPVPASPTTVTAEGMEITRVTVVRGEDHPALAEVWENDADDAPAAPGDGASPPDAPREACCPHSEGKHWPADVTRNEAPEAYCSKCSDFDDSDTPEGSRGFSKHPFTPAPPDAGGGRDAG